jgi:sugar transferase (PEP-CTERM system associated)
MSSRHACLGCGELGRLSISPYQAGAISLGLLLVTISIGLYNSDAAHDLRTYLKRFLVSWEVIAAAAAVFVAATGLAAVARFGLTPGLLLAGALGIMGVQVALRVALGWWFARPALRRRVLVLGDGAGAEKLAGFLRGPGRRRFQHLATLGGAAAETGPVRQGNVLLASAPSTAPRLTEVAQALRSEEVIVAFEDPGALPVDELLECKLRGVSVIDALDFWEREAGVVELAQGAGAWLALSEGLTIGRARRAVKRVVDIAISASFMFLAAPFCLLVAAAIRLESPGPVFYRQERIGLDGAVFRVWKFRSMRADAEADGAPRWAASGDDRVTLVGRFIRKTRIDEIPQVLNVLAGDMSFIGPRPERPFFVDQLRQQIPYYDLRHRVRPGITGWAQVNYPYGASVEDARRKLAYDLYYLKRCSLVLDLVILLQTVRVVLFAHGGR